MARAQAAALSNDPASTSAVLAALPPRVLHAPRIVATRVALCPDGQDPQAILDGAHRAPLLLLDTRPGDPTTLFSHPSSLRWESPARRGRGLLVAAEGRRQPAPGRRGGARRRRAPAEHRPARGRLCAL